MEWSEFLTALRKALRKRKWRNKGWLEVVWETLVHWLKPKVRGAVGERVLEGRLKLALRGSGAVVYGPFMLRRGDGAGTSEVDGLVIARTGVFVIEAKTYKGAVEGRAEDENWVQVLGRSRREFQNPLRQNYGHMKDVKRVLGKELAGEVHGVVAFSGEAEFRGTRPVQVMDFGDVAGYVKGFRRGRGLTEGEVAEAKAKMDAAIAEVTPEEKKRHVARLKEMRAQRAQGKRR